MATIPSELVVEESPEFPLVKAAPGSSYTLRPAFEDAEDVIARVRASVLESALLLEGYLDMGSDLFAWSEMSIAAQAEILRDE